MLKLQLKILRQIYRHGNCHKFHILIGQCYSTYFVDAYNKIILFVSAFTSVICGLTVGREILIYLFIFFYTFDFLQNRRVRHAAQFNSILFLINPRCFGKR